MFIVVPIVDSSGILCEGCRVYILFTWYWREELVDLCMRPLDIKCYVNLPL